MNLKLLASVVLVHMVHTNSRLPFTQDRTLNYDCTLHSYCCTVVAHKASIAGS